MTIGAIALYLAIFACAAAVLAIARVQWLNRDAREAAHALRDTLNTTALRLEEHEIRLAALEQPPA